MECREPRAFWRNSGAKEKVGDAILHFFGGFVGERDGENRFGGYAARDELGHTKRDGARLAGSRPREDEDRTFGTFGGETLFRVQRVEKVLHEFGKEKW